jgi:hypothetical protein
MDLQQAWRETKTMEKRDDFQAGWERDDSQAGMEMDLEGDDLMDLQRAWREMEIDLERA